MSSEVELHGKNKTEAEFADSGVGYAADTEQLATVSDIIKPTSTTVHAIGTTRRSCWIRLRTFLVITIPILAPFLNVTTHDINAKLIGFIDLNWMCFRITVSNIACHLI